jgi:hypothetical protein
MKKEIQILTLAILAFVALSGCGAQKFQTNNGGIITGNTNLSSTSPNAAAAKCSHDVDNLSDLSIRLKVFEDPSSGVRNDLIRVKFDRFPTYFTNDSDAIQLWTRTVDSAGNWGPWHKVAFYVERYNSSGILRTPYKYTDITWGQLKQIADYFGMGTSLSAPEMFGSVVLLAQLDDASVSKVLDVKIYAGSNSPDTLALIPQFAANPKEYAKNHPSVLQALHPLQALASANYTEEQYAYEANQFCF